MLFSLPAWGTVEIERVRERKREREDERVDERESECENEKERSFKKRISVAGSPTHSLALLLDYSSGQPKLFFITLTITIINH